jgi:hypothetical protein
MDCVRAGLLGPPTQADEPATAHLIGQVKPNPPD